MQGHDRLARTGATLNYQQSLQWRTDDLVLFALDGGDDVAESTCSGCFERGDKRSVALNVSARCLFVEPAEVAEELVVDIEQGTAAGRKMAAAVEAERVGSCRPIERLGSGSSPVDDYGVLSTVPHTDATDVQRIAKLFVVVDAAKDQRRITDVELVETIDDVLGEGLALEPGLVRTTCADLEVAR